MLHRNMAAEGRKSRGAEECPGHAPDPECHHLQRASHTDARKTLARACHLVAGRIRLPANDHPGSCCRDDPCSPVCSLRTWPGIEVDLVDHLGRLLAILGDVLE